MAVVVVSLSVCGVVLGGVICKLLETGDGSWIDFTEDGELYEMVVIVRTLHMQVHT